MCCSWKILEVEITHLTQLFIFRITARIPEIIIIDSPLLLSGWIRKPVCVRARLPADIHGPLIWQTCHLLTAVQRNPPAAPVFFQNSCLTDGTLSLSMACHPGELQRSMQRLTLFFLFPRHLTKLANNDLFPFTADSTLCQLISSKSHCTPSAPSVPKGLMLFDS